MENHIYLSRCVQVTSETWRTAMRIVTRVGDLVQRIGDGQAQVGYSVAGRSEGRVTLCAVCTIHVEMRSVGFLVEPQNQGQVYWLSLKTMAGGFPVWTSKSPCRFLSLGLKIKQTTVCWLCHKNDRRMIQCGARVKI
jgi:hypothetical protein